MPIETSRSIFEEVLLLGTARRVPGNAVLQRHLHAYETRGASFSRGPLPDRFGVKPLRGRWVALGMYPWDDGGFRPAIG